MRLKTQDHNTYPLVKLVRPKAIEMKKTANGHVVALDISIISKLDAPMAKDWGQTHMQAPYSQVHAVLGTKIRFAFTKSQTHISGLSQLKENHTLFKCSLCFTGLPCRREAFVRRVIARLKAKKCSVNRQGLNSSSIFTCISFLTNDTR